MLPRLEAQEMLDAVTVAALGGGNSDRKDREKALDALRLRARGGVREKAAKAQPQDLAAMGIAVTQGNGDLPKIASLDAFLGNVEPQEPSDG